MKAKKASSFKFSTDESVLLKKCILLLLVDWQFCMCYATNMLYTNEFAVNVVGGIDVASQVALRHGFVNKGQIGSLKDFYLFEHHNIQKRSMGNSPEHHKLLTNHPSVLWVEQQHVKHRVKREQESEQYLYADFPDPLYPDQWFLHHGGDNGFDMNVLPAWADGYTGKDVVVTFLDDGVQTNHPDLAQNYDKLASLDINGGDDDPTPQDNGENNHGTRCAGVVASVAFNNFCGVGVAYNASIGGIRLLDGTVTDATEATALSHNPNHIHIYSASWGPEDDGKKVDGPGPLAKFAFAEGAKKGRSGLGSIFIWASGNGGKNLDSCNCDGYTNSIYTLSISSATQRGTMPWYLEQCSSTLATTYSSGTSSRDKNIPTVDLDFEYLSDIANNKPADPTNLCTTSHTGTSASAPIAAGICALALEANPNLSWRDMQYIVIMTSRPEPLKNEEGWGKNKVGRLVSTKFGYGLMDASAMVQLAKKWHTVPAQHVCESSPDSVERLIPSTSGKNVEGIMNTSGCKNMKNAVVYLEHVQVKVTLHFKPRGNLKIVLVSPSGTASTVLHPRIHDINDSIFDDWPFMTVHFWGEKADGTWRLIIINSGSNPSPQQGKLIKWSLVLYGTSKWPVNLDDEKRTEHRSPAIHNYDYITEEFQKDDQLLNECSNTRKYKMLTSKLAHCVDKCPEGYYADARSSTCNECAKSCSSCFGPSYDNCLSCPNKLYLSKNICEKSCQDGYYADVQKKECLPCSADCITCEHSYDICLSCKPHFFRYGKKCVSSCSHNSFLHKYTCKKCHSTCASCHDESEFDCLSCSSGLTLFNGTCLSDCPDGFYSDERYICIRCPQACRTCAGERTCISCYTGADLIDGCCVFNVEQRNVCSDSNLRNCISCVKNCAFCDGPNYCVQCEREYYWSGSHCVQSCPRNTYVKGSECYNCADMCQHCITHRECLFCEKGLILHKGNCMAACPLHYYIGDKQQCLECDVSCLQCMDDTPYSCTSCKPGNFLFNNTCLTTCPEGYFRDVAHSECLPCYHFCKTCTGLGPFKCTSCHSNSDLVGQTCVPCLDDEYFDQNSKSCLRCHSKCGRCSGSSEFNCLSCQPPLRLDETKHSCFPCCNNGDENVECCTCSKNLDVCISSAEHPRSVGGGQVEQPSNEVSLPMRHVLLTVIVICSSAILLFVVVFAILQARSMGYFHFKKDYKRVPLTARFGSEMETVSLTRADLDEEDEIYEKT